MPAPMHPAMGEPAAGAVAARLAGKPRIRFAHVPTPLEPLRNADRAIPGARARVLVKRDDLTGFATAGNKARLLEFLVADAADRGARAVVGCGPTTSNFIASLAQASAVCGLACEVFVPGPVVEHPGVVLARAAGATVTSVPLTRHEIDGFVADRAAGLTRQGMPAYAIPRGGATPVGALGYALAAQEVVGQLGPDGDAALVVPAGSCASAAGLLAGLTVLDAPHRVIAVSTNREVGEAREVLLSLATAVVDRLGGARADPADRLTLVDRASGTTAEDLAFVGSVLREAGVVAADHYGPPTLTEVVAAARKGVAGTVVWWHTGGTLGLPRLLDALAAATPGPATGVDA